MTVFKHDMSSAVRASSSIAMFAICLTASLSSFAQPVTSQIKTAQITIEAVSNTSAKRGKNFAVTYYADESCSRRGKSHRVFEKRYAKDTHTFNELKVEVDQAFIFQVAYVEKRRGEIRRCTSMANVDLQENKKYKAVFTIIDEVLGCNIKIYDLSATADNGEEVTQVDGASLNETSTSDVAENSDQQDSVELKVPNSVVEMEFKKPNDTCSRVGKKGFGNGTPVYTYEGRL